MLPTHYPPFPIAKKLHLVLRSSQQKKKSNFQSNEIISREEIYYLKLGFAQSNLNNLTQNKSKLSLFWLEFLSFQL